jgi:hypothetical protein
MSFNNSLNTESRNPNDRNHILDLPIRIRLYVRSRLYNRNKEVRNCTSFFRLNRTLSINGLTREKIKSIPIGKIA